MIKSFFIYILISLISVNLYAQNSERERIQKEIDEVMKARDEMLKMLLDNNSFQNFDKRMEEMMKRFGGSDFGFESFNPKSFGEYDWVEDTQTKTLKIKVTQIKDKPLDIKIQNGMITFKGEIIAVDEVTKAKSKMMFQQSMSLPTDIDQNNPEFIDKNGEILVKFKKLSTKKAPLDRKPIVPDNGDLSI